MQGERKSKRDWARIYLLMCTVRAHIHTYSLSSLFLLLFFLPKLLSEMDGRNTQCACAYYMQQQQPLCTFPSWYRVANWGVVGIAQCAVHTMPTTDANTTCPTQNNPLYLQIAIEGWRRTAVRNVAIYIHTHTHAHTHIYMCVCVCMCIHMRMRVSPPHPTTGGVVV